MPRWLAAGRTNLLKTCCKRFTPNPNLRSGLMRSLSFGIILVMTSTLAAQDKKELEKLAGKWQPTMMQIGETKTPAEQLKQRSLTIEGDKYHVVVSGQS